MARLLLQHGTRAERVAALRHLLSGCEWCSAVTRRAAPGPWDVSYDQVIDRVIARLPELIAQVATGCHPVQGPPEPSRAG